MYIVLSRTKHAFLYRINEHKHPFDHLLFCNWKLETFVHSISFELSVYVRRYWVSVDNVYEECFTECHCYLK